MPEGTNLLRPPPGPPDRHESPPRGAEAGETNAGRSRGAMPGWSGPEGQVHGRSFSGIPAAARSSRRRWTLRQRLALVYGAVSVVVLLGSGAFTWWQAAALSERNTDLALAETRRLADRVGSALTQALQGVAVLATADPFSLGSGRCETLVNNAHLTMDAMVSHLFVFDEERRVVCSTLPWAIGRQTDSPVVIAAELTGRPVTGALDSSALGLGTVISVGHPIHRSGTTANPSRPAPAPTGDAAAAPGAGRTAAPQGSYRAGQRAGVVAATVSLQGLRATSTRLLPEINGLRVWLLDSASHSVSLVGPDAPLPNLPDALHTSYVAPLPAEAGIATEGDRILIQARATDDLSLIASVPRGLIEADARADIILPPLILAAVLLGGMGALFWSAERFVVAPLEAATRQLEAADAPLATARTTESGAADVADLIRRLGATRHTRDEAIRLRDMLLREAHHRIKNHLSLVASFLRLQERQLSDHAALQALRAAQGRMVAIGMTYELLHDGPGDTVSLDQTLERFARALAARDLAEGQGTRLLTELEPLEVPADIAVKIALVVNELATNALKYAFAGGAAGCVRIVLRRADPGGDFTLHVSDNGIGMPESGRRGLGMTVVDTLLRSIDATLGRLPGPGTAFIIGWSAGGAPARPG